MSTGCDGLVAIDATRTDDADGSRQLAVLGMHLLHHSGLNGRGVGAEQDVLGDIVGMLADEESVLHVTGWMVGSEIHLGEDVVVVFHLRSVGQYESHAREDVDDLVGDDGQRVARTKLDGVGSTCQVDGLVGSLL